MEIVKSDDKLREEILNDAETKAARIIKKAEREAEDIEKKESEHIKNLEEEYITGTEKSISEMEKLLYASVDIEARKKIMGLIGEQVDSVFEEIRQMIIDGSLISLSELYRNLIRECALLLGCDTFIIEAGKLTLSVINKTELKKIKLKNGTIVEVIETEIADGMMLKSGNGKIATFISLDQFIKELKERERTFVYGVITGQ